MTGSESVSYCDMTFNGHGIEATMESTNQTTTQGIVSAEMPPEHPPKLKEYLILYIN